MRVGLRFSDQIINKMVVIKFQLTKNLILRCKIKPFASLMIWKKLDRIGMNCCQDNFTFSIHIMNQK